MVETLTQGQRRTVKARQVFTSRFATEEDRSDFYRRIGAKGNDGRIVLTAQESAALAEAYALLGRIAERARSKVDAAPG